MWSRVRSRSALLSIATALIPIREGELFSVEKIRKALDAMKELYGTHRFVVSPTTNIVDDRPRISLVMKIDQQKQFHVGTIEVFSSNPAIEPP